MSVSVREFPPGTWPIDAVAGQGTRARLVRELGWIDLAEAPEPSPDGKFGLLTSAEAREIAVLGPRYEVVLRRRNPYRTLHWIAEHTLVGDDGQSLFRMDVDRQEPFVRVRPSPKIQQPACQKPSPRDCHRRVLCGYDVWLEHAVTCLRGPDVFSDWAEVEVVDLDLGASRRVLDVRAAGDVSWFDSRWICRSVPISPDSSGGHPSTSAFSCAESPWQRFDPWLVTDKGPGFVASDGRYVVLSVEGELHVFEPSAGTERMVPAADFSVTGTVSPGVFVGSRRHRAVFVDVPREKFVVFEPWLPGDVEWIGHRIHVQQVEPLRFVLETGTVSPKEPPSKRRIFSVAARTSAGDDRGQGVPNR